MGHRGSAVNGKIFFPVYIIQVMEFLNFALIISIIWAPIYGGRINDLVLYYILLFQAFLIFCVPIGLLGIPHVVRDYVQFFKWKGTEPERGNSPEESPCKLVFVYMILHILNTILTLVELIWRIILAVQCHSREYTDPCKNGIQKKVQWSLLVLTILAFLFGVIIMISIFILRNLLSKTEVEKDRPKPKIIKKENPSRKSQRIEHSFSQKQFVFA
jgi:NADH:ubiquinone oxidoreductase subunit 5 (subunit L)/multisubunit Na+/H+ antiporter MnhA subunit